MPLREGRGVRRLLANAILNFHISLTERREAGGGGRGIKKMYEKNGSVCSVKKVSIGWAFGGYLKTTSATNCAFQCGTQG